MLLLFDLRASSSSTEPRVPNKQKAKPAERRQPSSTHPVPDPGPAQAGLGRHPDPDPESKVPKCSAKPAPCTEEENGSSLVPAALSPDHGPEEGPQNSPSSPKCRPDPEPGEEDQPPSPPPQESGSITTENERDSDVGPVEQNPVRSPHYSPPVSLSLTLAEEDEDSLSSLFQHSPSEDSGGSPTPSLGHTKQR